MQQTTPWLPIGTFIGGFIINEALHRWRESRTAKKERTAVASSLAVEICTHAERTMLSCNIFGGIGLDEQGNARGSVRLDTVLDNQPLVPTVYHAVADKVASLGANPAAAVISFYQILESISLYIDKLGNRLAGVREPVHITRDQTRVLYLQWQLACLNAQAAVNAIEPIAEPNIMRPTEMPLGELKLALGQLADGATLDLRD